MTHFASPVEEYLARQEQRQPDIRALWADAIGDQDPINVARVAEFLLTDPTLPELLPFPPA